MKHTLAATSFLIGLFVVSQIVGLATVNTYIQVDQNEDGTVDILHEDTVIGEQVDLTQQEKTYTFIAIIIMVLLGTGILLLIIRYKLGLVWKSWFFIAIALTLTISFDVYITRWLALFLGVSLALVRILKPNVMVHNLTEIFVYTGISIMLVPLLNVISGVILLILISIYDMFAVWKSKHMVKLAEFQLESKSFAGLALNYHLPATGKKHAQGKKSGHTAILGGGDIAFPLLFSSAVMEHLIIARAIPKLEALLYSLIITAGAALALTFLLFSSKKDRFYPAMPFITAGCFIAYFLILLIV